MVLKKTSAFIKSVLLLISISVLAVLHFWMSNINEIKLKETSNLIILLEANDAQLEKLSPKPASDAPGNTHQKEEISNAAKFIEYTISTITNGGEITRTKKALHIPKPDKESIRLIKEAEKNWIDFYNSFKQYSYYTESDITFYNLNQTYTNLKSKLDKISDLQYIKLDNQNFQIRLIHLTAALLYILLSFILFLLLKNSFIKNINSVENLIKNIANSDEINAEINVYEDFSGIRDNLLTLNLKNTEITKFINQLVNGNYNVQFEQFNKKDFLESSLVQLRNKLKENIELDKKRQEEEKLRQWFAEGQAKFNDILRESSTSISLLAEASLKNIVKFFNAAQGGFFILKEDEHESYLELSCAFAYDRIKSLTKRVSLGDGLIGMSALEKNTIWLNNIPEDYMEIESGLGEAPPGNILIIPVKTDENLLGVIEIASFQEFNKNEVEFIENIAGNIASTLETTKITDKTSILLEESKKKSDELAERDTEMSEKIHQLRDAQIETKRSETEMVGLISAVDKVLYKIELSSRGKINSANQLFVSDMNMRTEELKNMNFFELTDSKDKETIEKIINEVKNKKTSQLQLTFISKDNKQIKVNSLFSPIHNEQGQIVKILVLAENINDVEKLKEINNALNAESILNQSQLSETDKLSQENISKYIEKYELAEKEINNYKIKENQVKEKFETIAEKKYSEWLNSFKSQ